MAGIVDHWTAVLLVPVTVAVNCDFPPPLNVVKVGLRDICTELGTVGDAPLGVVNGWISIASILALSTLAANWMRSSPVVTDTLNVSSRARLGPPA